VEAERNFPVTELIPVASEKSVGKEITFKGKQYKVVSVEDAIKMKPDVAIFSAGGSTSLAAGAAYLQQQAQLLLIIHRHGAWTLPKNW
jgi:aspartate-semialdehyde dehydrogenase